MYLNRTIYSRFSEIGDTVLDASYLFLRDGIVYFLYKVLIAEFSKVITKLNQIRHHGYEKNF